MKNALLGFILIVIGFSQSEEKNKSFIINTFCSTPNEGKVEIEYDYSFLFGSSYFNENGNNMDINTLVFYKDLENYYSDFLINNFSTIDSSNIANHFQFKDGNNLSQHLFKLKFDYYGKNRIGFYGNLGFIKFNNRLLSANKFIIDFDENEKLVMEVDAPFYSTNFKFGLYYVWDEFFKIQKIKSDFQLYMLNGQIGYGSSLSFDYFISKKLRISNQSSLLHFPSITDYYSEYSITSFNSLSGNNTLSVAINDVSTSLANYISYFGKFRVIYDFQEKIAFSLDLIYFAENFDFEFDSNKYILNGKTFVIKPKIGYKILSNFDYGFLNIDNISLNSAFTIPLFGEDILKPTSLQFYTKVNFN